VRQQTRSEELDLPWWERAWELNKMELARPLLGMSFSGGERNNVFFSRQGKSFLGLAGVSGVDDKSDPMGFVYLDYDRDGCVDIGFASRQFPGVKLFRNNLCHASGRHSISLRFVGGNRTDHPSEYSARDGYGTRAIAEVNGETRMRELRCGEGWRTQNTSALMIGIGEARKADRLTVRWPSGKEQVFTDVPSDGLVFVYENPVESPSGSGLEVRRFDFGSSRGQASSSERGEMPLAAAPESELSMFTAMATWCEACQRELPGLARLRDAFATDELALLGVPTDPEDDAAKLDAYIAKHDPPYRLLSELPAEKRAAFQEFVRRQVGTEALPATVIVRRDGTTLYAAPGIPTLSEIRRLLR